MRNKDEYTLEMRADYERSLEAAEEPTREQLDELNAYFDRLEADERGWAMAAAVDIIRAKQAGREEHIRQMEQSDLNRMRRGA